MATDYLIPEGILLSFKRDGVVYHASCDALASVRLVTDEEGEVVSRFDYSGYGTLLDGSFDGVPGGMPFGWVGGLGVRFDRLTGLFCMRNRWYDPGVQRFLSRDSLGLLGGPNLHIYAENNPARMSDPDGLCPWQTQADEVRDTDPIKMMDPDMSKRAWLAEQAAWQYFGGKILGGIGYLAKKSFGFAAKQAFVFVGSRFAPLVNEAGQALPSQALKNLIRREIPVFEFPFLKPDYGRYWRLCNVIVVGSNAPKWVWLEEFGHSMLKTPLTQLGVLMQEIFIKGALVRGASKYGLTQIDKGALMETIEGYFEAFRAGLL